MHPEIKAAVQGIEKLYGQQLAACVALRDFIFEIARPWCGRPLDPGTEDGLLAALFARSSNTYWAGFELARIGFGEQALMLNRSLFEDMVDAHWVTVQPEVAQARYSEHSEHGEMLLTEAIRHHPRDFDLEDLPDFDPGRRKELDYLFGEHGHKSWTGINLHTRVDAIEHLWTDQGAREGLHFFRRIAHRENNQTLHVSAQALNQLVRSSSATEIAFKSGPGAEAVERALCGAFWIAGQLTSLVLEHFSFDRATRDEFHSLFVEKGSVFGPLSEELRAAGRDDP